MIRLEDITLGYAGGATPIRGLTATLPARGVVAVTGPSGCGKTTLLRLLAGLLPPLSGRLEGLDGLRVSAVFQEDRLLPWLTVKENVALVNGEGDPLVWLKAMELEEKQNEYPGALSGGMQRRTALARALHFGGDILLLDEPFKGLDEALRARVAPILGDAFPLLVLAAHSAREAQYLGRDDVTEIVIPYPRAGGEGRTM